MKYLTLEPLKTRGPWRALLVLCLFSFTKFASGNSYVESSMGLHRGSIPVSDRLQKAQKLADAFLDDKTFYGLDLEFRYLHQYTMFRLIEKQLIVLGLGFVQSEASEGYPGGKLLLKQTGLYYILGIRLYLTEVLRFDLKGWEPYIETSLKSLWGRVTLESKSGTQAYDVQSDFVPYSYSIEAGLDSIKLNPWGSLFGLKIQDSANLSIFAGLTYKIGWKKRKNSQ